ncbi:hypothetical protein T484DRAFT_2912720 [Baffinella frigidus]|nr:hypothetical protein T484DRAFT_2912720 [Cryptophyta sp. CCMP2293]
MVGVERHDGLDHHARLSAAANQQRTMSHGAASSGGRADRPSARHARPVWHAPRRMAVRAQGNPATAEMTIEGGGARGGGILTPGASGAICLATHRHCPAWSAEWRDACSLQEGAAAMLECSDWPSQSVSLTILSGDESLPRSLSGVMAIEVEGLRLSRFSLSIRASPARTPLRADMLYQGVLENTAGNNASMSAIQAQFRPLVDAGTQFWLVVYQQLPVAANLTITLAKCNAASLLHQETSSASPDEQGIYILSLSSHPLTAPFCLTITSTPPTSSPIRFAYRVWTEATFPSFRREPPPWLRPPTPPPPAGPRVCATLAPAAPATCRVPPAPAGYPEGATCEGEECPWAAFRVPFAREVVEFSVAALSGNLSNCTVTLSAAAGFLPSLAPNASSFFTINASSVNTSLSNGSNANASAEDGGEEGRAASVLSLTLHPAADASDLFVTVQVSGHDAACNGSNVTITATALPARLSPALHAQHLPTRGSSHQMVLAWAQARYLTFRRSPGTIYMMDVTVAAGEADVFLSGGDPFPSRLALPPPRWRSEAILGNPRVLLLPGDCADASSAPPGGGACDGPAAEEERDGNGQIVDPLFFLAIHAPAAATLSLRISRCAAPPRRIDA